MNWLKGEKTEKRLGTTGLECAAPAPVEGAVGEEKVEEVEGPAVQTLGGDVANACPEGDEEVATLAPTPSQAEVRADASAKLNPRTKGQKRRPILCIGDSMVKHMKRP